MSETRKMTGFSFCVKAKIFSEAIDKVNAIGGDNIVVLCRKQSKKVSLNDGSEKTFNKMIVFQVCKDRSAMQTLGCTLRVDFEDGSSSSSDFDEALTSCVFPAKEIVPLIGILSKTNDDVLFTVDTEQKVCEVTTKGVSLSMKRRIPLMESRKLLYDNSKPLAAVSMKGSDMERLAELAGSILVDLPSTVAGRKVDLDKIGINFGKVPKYIVTNNFLVAAGKLCATSVKEIEGDTFYSIKASDFASIAKAVSQEEAVTISLKGKTAPTMVDIITKTGTYYLLPLASEPVPSNWFTKCEELSQVYDHTIEFDREDYVRAQSILMINQPNGPLCMGFNAKDLTHLEVHGVLETGGDKCGSYIPAKIRLKEGTAEAEVCFMAGYLVKLLNTLSLSVDAKSGEVEKVKLKVSSSAFIFENGTLPDTNLIMRMYDKEKAVAYYKAGAEKKAKKTDKKDGKVEEVAEKK